MINSFTPPTPFSNVPLKLPVNQLQSSIPQQQNNKQQKPPEVDLPRVVQFGADLSGCGLYRLGWVSHLLNFQGKAMITDTNVMILDERWYSGLKVVRLQRQATTPQKEFVKFLKEVQKKHGFRLIYEVDDVVFREDIPDYNKFKSAFTSDEIRNNVVDIINMCDEVTVTCDFMRELYSKRTGKQEITVIPNFPAKFWIGNYFNPQRINELYDKNKKKPRIGYMGSGAHMDVDNRTGQKDDFEHTIKAIIDSRHKYQWVFMGAFPNGLRPYVERGEIEFHPWQRLYDYPQKIYDLGLQMFVAPLQDNAFNKAKSDLKYIEACAYGLPVACQDLCTYADAEIKFKTGEEMIECLDEELRRAGHYKNSVYKRRKVAEDRFMELDKNIDCYMELFTLPYGDPRRKNLKRYNP
jgi:hypothetical protein